MSRFELLIELKPDKHKPPVRLRELYTDQERAYTAHDAWKVLLCQPESCINVVEFIEDRERVSLFHHVKPTDSNNTNNSPHLTLVAGAPANPVVVEVKRRAASNR